MMEDGCKWVITQQSVSQSVEVDRRRRRRYSIFDIRYSAPESKAGRRANGGRVVACASQGKKNEMKELQWRSNTRRI
jgi:hypothetical protein